MRRGSAGGARSLLLGGVTSYLFMLRASVAGDNFLTIGIGNACLIAAFACCWQGARAFDRRPPVWSAVVGAPVLWARGLLLVRTSSTTVPYRIVLSSG